MVHPIGPNGKQLRGLALLSPEKRREIAIKGGKAGKRGRAKGRIKSDKSI